VRHSPPPPGVPQDVHPPVRVLLRVFRGAVEVGEAAAVEPPAGEVVPRAAALHRVAADGAGRVAAVVVHVRGAEGSRVLVLVLVVAAKGIT